MALQLCRQLVGQASEPFFGFLCWIACRINLRLLGSYITTHKSFLSVQCLWTYGHNYTASWLSRHLEFLTSGHSDGQAERPPLPYGHSYKVWCARPSEAVISVNQSIKQSIKETRLGGDLSSRTIASYTGDSQLMSSKYSGKAPSVQ